MALQALAECPLCQAPASMLETLVRGWHCNACAQYFEVNADGRVIRWRTNHEPRKTDVSGTEMPDP